MGLGKIKVMQVPIDYFPRDDFQRILDTTLGTAEQVADSKPGFPRGLKPR